MSPIEDTRVYESRYQQIAVEMARKSPKVGMK